MHPDSPAPETDHETLPPRGSLRWVIFKLVEYATRRSFAGFKFKVLGVVAIAFTGNYWLEVQRIEDGDWRVLIGQGDDEYYLVPALIVFAIVLILVDYRVHVRNLELKAGEKSKSA